MHSAASLSLYLATSSKEAILVVETGAGTFGWKVSKEPYTCTVGVAKKGAKFAGLKPFMNYPLTPSFSNIQVQNDSVNSSRAVHSPNRGSYYLPVPRPQ
jgi:hypothetical protein